MGRQGRQNKTITVIGPVSVLSLAVGGPGFDHLPLSAVVFTVGCGGYTRWHSDLHCSSGGEDYRFRVFSRWLHVPG